MLRTRPARLSLPQALSAALLLALAPASVVAQVPGFVLDEQKISDTEGGFSGTLDGGAAFSFSVAALGDLDGDGVTDLAVGAPNDNDGGTNRGAVWVLFLDGDGGPRPTVDGDLSDPEYRTLATKRNTNSGFGPDVDVSEIVYFADDDSGLLYLGLKGKLNTASSDGFGLWLDFSEPAGAPAGTALGGVPVSGHFIGSGDGPSYTADFEVDYAFAVNTGFSNTLVFFDAATYVGAPDADYLGVVDQSGTPTVGPPDETTNNGNPAFFNTVAFAFDNAGTGTTGLEFVIPYADLGITGTGEMSAFAFVVSGNAYFSDVTVPGDVTAGNLGYDPSFSANMTSADCSCPNPAAPIGTGPYHATVSLVGGSPPDYDLAVTPTGPLTVPPGGQLSFDYTIANNTASAATGDFYFVARRSGNAVAQAVVQSGTLPAVQTVGGNTTINVPSGAPPGGYELTFSIGNAFGLSVDDEAFTVTVSSSAARGGSTEWTVHDVTPWVIDGTAPGSPGPHASTAALPHEVTLSEVYPNPFRDRATIGFSLPEAERVTVVVYDVLGREVARLVDGELEVGRHETVLDGSDLPSGVYLVRLTAAGVAQTQQITLLR